MIQCAVLGDGVTSPASEVFDQMLTGNWTNPNSSEIPDLDQISIIDELFAICEEFAEYGEPASPNDINQLEYGVWEFKADWARVTFYDTDGVGAYTPKITKYSLSNKSRNELPYFDPDLRVATCLSKVTQRTKKPDLKYTRQVRQEDIAHDKPNARTNADSTT